MRQEPMPRVIRVGITGHQSLPDPATWKWVEARIDDFIEASGAIITGLTSLAIGADQLFAALVLSHGGNLYAIVPHADYESTFTTKEDRRRYQSLLSEATEIEVLKTPGSKEDAYLAAGYRVADLAEVVLAVWNGKPAAGKGGTADMVEYALTRGVTVVHINPVTCKVEKRDGGQKRGDIQSRLS
jgi:hypothetical protein